MRFLEGLTETRKDEILRQLRAVWSHDSTALEGNTLTLGDTMFVLAYGLTVKGKPLKDQVDVQNHAKAVDHVLAIFKNGSITEKDVFALHRLVINEQPTDIYRPIGAYKREPNGTYRVGADGKSVYHAYLLPDETPMAMAKWIAAFNQSCRADAGEEELLELFARLHNDFTAIHPFYDGNGRLARLLANIPVLFAGQPPIVIPTERREDYLRATWSAEAGDLNPFKELLRDSWRVTRDLVKAT